MAAVGSFTVTASDLGGQLTKYSVAWTSSSGGAVSGVTMALKRGRILAVKYVPTNGGSQPSNDYTVQLLDGDGVDALCATGVGSGLSNTAASIAVPAMSSLAAFLIDPTQTYTPTVASAGNVKNGRFDLFVGPG
jgi:hypothetical protein